MITSYVRPESVWLFPVDRPPISLRSDDSVATCLSADPGDIEMVSYGARSFMWLVRSQQGVAPLNRAATHALRINGLRREICGDVVVRHESVRLSRRTG